ncbi:UDP-glucoronosyl and UDP-glucosyl transferase [Popillia japonica]|uniref:UDP-glucoronosyl and UDP-glucosyl transferase n=1 Tax=Popillia japonica TaxID=7064 RepID=A0AAW1LDC0_POPJA
MHSLSCSILHKGVVIILLITLLLVNYVSPYRILGVFPHAGKSHFDVFEPMFLELAKKGHNITMISHFPQKKLVPGYYDISLAGTTKILVNVLPFGIMGNSKLSRIFHVFDLAILTNHVCESGLNSQPIQDFIRRNEKYDVVITEFFTTNCFVGLMHVTGGSLIGLTSGGMIPWISDFLGTPDHPSYIPSLFIGHSDKMNFIDKIENTLIYLVSKIGYIVWIDRPANAYARKYIHPTVSELNTYVFNASLLLTNVHHTLHGPRPHTSSVIEVGGMHLKKVKKLPQVFGF